MAFVDLVTDAPDDETRALFDQELAQRGYVPNLARAFALRPGVYQAWRGLVTEVMSNMDERRYELATLAAARRLRSTYCMLAHGSVLARKFFTGDEVAAIARDDYDALEPVDRAVMELADRVAADATAVTREDVERLREHGLDVVLAATIRCFFSKTLDALAVEPDDVYAALDPGLRDALVVGRPLA
jgi:alkylhydroperoxidase family enzyme